VFTSIYWWTDPSSIVQGISNYSRETELPGEQQYNRNILYTLSLMDWLINCFIDIWLS